MSNRRASVIGATLIVCCLTTQTVVAKEDLARCNVPADDPSRIAIAGGSITEVIYDLGAEDLILAVDLTSNYPPAALQRPQVGYVRNLSAEGILSLGPTLVIGEDDMGPPAVVEQLRATGIEIRRLVEVHTAQGILSKVRCIGTIIDLSPDEIDAAIARLIPTLSSLAAVDNSTKPKVAFLFSLSDGLPTAAGAGTSAAGVIEMAGGHNVFGDFEGWKPVSLEAMAKSNPDYIIMPARGLKNSGGLEAVLNHPAVRLTSAGMAKRVIAIDGMTLLGFGPRTLGAAVELARTFGTLSPE